jgi:hypothetical protein
METNLYLSTITNLCDVIIGTSKMLGTRGGTRDETGKPDRDPPEAGGYPVVVKFKPSTIICSWCGEEAQTPNTKQITRAPGSFVWEGKCKDCKKKVTTPFKD